MVSRIASAYRRGEPIAAPIGDIEGRIGEDEVGLQVRVAVVVEAVAVGDLSLDAANGKVHLGETPSCVVGFLAVDRDIGFGALGRFSSIAVTGSVRTDKLDRLHKHSG